MKRQRDDADITPNGGGQIIPSLQDIWTVILSFCRQSGENRFIAIKEHQYGDSVFSLACVNKSFNMICRIAMKSLYHPDIVAWYLHAYPTRMATVMQIHDPRDAITRAASAMIYYRLQQKLHCICFQRSPLMPFVINVEIPIKDRLEFIWYCTARFKSSKWPLYDTMNYINRVFTLILSRPTITNVADISEIPQHLMARADETAIIRFDLYKKTLKLKHPLAYPKSCVFELE